MIDLRLIIHVLFFVVQGMLKQRISIMNTAHQRGVANHPIHPLPPGSAPAALLTVAWTHHEVLLDLSRYWELT